MAIPVFAGGGIHSIHINGGQYKNIIVQKLATGQLRIVTTDAYDENGLPLVIAEDAVDDTVYINGLFDSVTIYAPGAQVIMDGDDSSVGTMTVTKEAVGSSITLGTGTEIGHLEIGATTEIKGDGTVKNGDINANGVVFEKRPVQWQEQDDLDVPPVMPDEPTPTPGGGGGGGGSVTPSQSGTPEFSFAGPYIPGETLTVGPGSLATQTNLTYTWYASDNKTYEAGTDMQINTGENYTVSASDLGKYLVVIATTPDIAGSGMAVSDDPVIAGQLSAVTINTQAPVTGNEMYNGSSTIDHATGPVVTWSADDGANFAAANAGDKFSAPIAYQTKYVYDADENYRFDKDIENTAGTAASTITVTNLATGSVTATVTTTSTSNDTLTITLTWPAATPPLVSDMDLSNRVTAPTAGANPVTSPFLGSQYSSSQIDWYKIKDNGMDVPEADQSPMGTSDTFQASCVYQAAFGLTAQNGYTFAGLAADSFSYTGADSVTNNAGTDLTPVVTVTITFPAIVAEPATFTLQKATCSGVSSSPSWGAFDVTDNNLPEPDAGYQIFSISGNYIFEVNTDNSKNEDDLGDTKYNTLGSDGNWSNYNSKTNYEPKVDGVLQDFPLVGSDSSGTIWTYDASTGQTFYGGTDYYTPNFTPVYYSNFKDAPYSSYNIKDMPLLGSCFASLASDGSGGYIGATYFVFLDAANNQLVLANADGELNNHQVVTIPAPTIPGGYKICGFTSDGEGTEATITVYICNKDQAYQR